MNEQRERLMAALFGNPEREHIDVKFCVGSTVDISPEQFFGEAANMLAQMDAGVGADETFAENFAQREVAVFLAQ